MAERLHTEDSKEAKWADIDDDDDNWVPPDTIEWNDGTKVTLEAAEPPKPTISAFEKQIGTGAIKDPRALYAPHGGPTPVPIPAPALVPVPVPIPIPMPAPAPAMMTAIPPLKPLEPPRKPDLVPSAPPSKIPWAPVPTGSFPTPLATTQPPPPFGARPPTTGRQVLMTTQAAKEVAADDFSRKSWRDRQPTQLPNTLFNSETGSFDPVGDASRNRDQGRRNSRAEGQGARPMLLQRSAGRGEPEHDPSFHQNRFQGRPEHDHQHPGMVPMDMGRRRSASIRSAGLSDTSSTATRDNRHLPPNNNVVSSGGGTVDSLTPRTSNQGPLYVSPTVAGGDPRFSRAGPPVIQPAMLPTEVEIVLEPGENPVEAQKRVMKDAREQARARRLAEEAAAEEEKKLRIQKKLAELDLKMKAELESKSEATNGNEATAGASGTVDEEKSTATADQPPAVAPLLSAEAQAHEAATKPTTEGSSLTGNGHNNNRTESSGGGLNGTTPPTQSTQPNVIHAPHAPQPPATTQTGNISTTQTTHPLSPIHAANTNWGVNGHAPDKPAAPAPAPAGTPEKKPDEAPKSPAEEEEVDIPALIRSIPNLAQLAKTKRDELIPGTRTTYQQLDWMRKNLNAHVGGDPRLDRAFDALNARATAIRDGQGAGKDYEEPEMTFKITKTERSKQRNVPAPAPNGETATKENTPAMQASEPSRFDEVKNKILNLAGQTFTARYGVKATAPPRWREPYVYPAEENSWKMGGKERFETRKAQAMADYQRQMSEWDAQQGNKKPVVEKVKPAPLKIIDPNLQVISKPAFQGADDGKPKVSLPRVVMRATPAIPTKPELPTTLPTEEDFNDMVFQQEFGSTPTVLLPTIVPTLSDDNAAGSQLAMQKRTGKEKKKVSLRDQDVMTRPTPPADLTSTFRIKLPGMLEPKIFQLPATYEITLKVQQPFGRSHRGGHHHGEARTNTAHPQAGRGDSGSSRTRSNNRRGQFTSPRATNQL
ncbi:hypothetical protein ABW20_dc0102470 [Dactylellina cionopaga]|nr:hypothetical protein ABW20_dc0102470 [Dactylellina cionopaga]